MTTGLFKRIFIVYGIILLLAITLAEIFVTKSVREHTITNLRENLAVQAALISDQVSFKPGKPLDPLCRTAKEHSGSRVTIIASDGRVLGDSDVDSSSLENHAHRPEIQQAALMGTGMFIRYSDTLRQDLMYVAYQARTDGQSSGFVRLSLPLENVDRAVRASRFNILVIVCCIILASGAFTFWQFDYLRRLTGTVSTFARSLVPGGIGKKLVLPDAGEFSEIVSGLNTMSEGMLAVIEGHEQERKRLNEILLSIPDALLIMDDRGTVALTSAAAVRFFADASLQGKSFMQILRNNAFYSLFEEVRTSGTAGVSEITIELPEERSCVVRISPIVHEDKTVIGYVALFHDITQMRKLEEVRKDFVANITHEIKTPITAIRGFAETLLDGAIDDREHARKFIETIKMNSQRINNLVDDLMTISKIELGVIKLLKTDTAFEDVIDEVMNSLRPKADRKNLALRTDIAHDLGPIMADHERLIQIMTNLVDNAIKFSDAGIVTISAREQEGSIVLSVDDTGIGIPEKHLTRLGERFYRVDTARSRDQGGTGLGLAIVKHLVKAHGWDMRIDSTPGKGTIVRIIISRP